MESQNATKLIFRPRGSQVANKLDRLEIQQIESRLKQLAARRLRKRRRWEPSKRVAEPADTLGQVAFLGQAHGRSISEWAIHPHAGVSHPQKFQNSTELRSAVDEYLKNQGRDTEVAKLYGWPIGRWRVSGIDHFSQIFSAKRNPKAATFNEDIGNWDVSRSKTMRGLFHRASSFNQSLPWLTSQVRDMSFMFAQASSFNGNVSSFDVRRVKTMAYTFSAAQAFDQPLDTWSTLSLEDTSGTFSAAASFDQDIGNWRVSRVNSMQSTFHDAPLFNQPLNWDTSNVIKMQRMFQGALAFNQSLASFDTSNVVNMESMFAYAESFDQDLSSFDVGQVRDMTSVFSGATAYGHDINSWEPAKCKYFRYMFFNAHSFSQNLCSWGWKIKHPQVNAASMFFNSSCPEQRDPVIPGDGPDRVKGPFCHAC